MIMVHMVMLMVPLDLHCLQVKYCIYLLMLSSVSQLTHICVLFLCMHRLINALVRSEATTFENEAPELVFLRQGWRARLEGLRGWISLPMSGLN